MIDYSNFIASLTGTERLVSNTIELDGCEVNKLVAEWISRKSLVNESYFNKRMDLEKLSKSDFAKSILLPSIDNIVAKEIIEKSDWFQGLKQALSYNDFDDSVNNVLAILKPFQKYIEIELDECISTIKNFDVNSQILDTVTTEITKGFLKYMIKNIVLDLNKKKSRNELVGESSEERFENYISSLCSSRESLEYFYSQAPVATRLISTRMIFSINFLRTALRRLDYHIKDLVKDGLLKRPIELSKVTFSNSDSHQKGNTVVIFEFDSKQKIVYKPRSLESEKSFNIFVEWLNSSNQMFDIYAVKVCDFGDYGYEEYIEYKSCNRTKDIQNYYFRFGNLVSLIYFLRGGDCHLENLIAHGQYPVLIDLETLIQNEVILDIRKSATVEINKELELNSVLGSALLPLVVFDNNESGEGVNVSALNGGGDKLPFKVLMPENINTDEFRFEYNEYYTEFSNNVPKIDDERVDFKDYIDWLIVGFDEMSNFIFKNKKKFIEKAGIFKGIKTRSILKGTNNYGQLLDYSTHPIYSKDMTDREKLLENMWAYPYRDKRVIMSEFKDMIFDDIPIFFNYTNSKDLIDSNGVVIPNYFEETSFDLMEKRICNITEEDLKYQKALMKFRINNVEFSHLSVAGSISKAHTKELEQEVTDTDLLESVFIIENKIDLLKVESRDNSGLSWANINKIAENEWSYRAMPIDLYGGLSGIALFYFELFWVTKDQQYKLKYEKILHEISIEAQYAAPSYSAYIGRNSFYFLLINEMSKSGESSKSSYLENFYNEVEEIFKKIDENQNDLDYLGLGSLIVLMIRYYELTKDAKMPNVILSFCSFLNNDKIRNFGEGMGHGKSGVRYVIAEASKIISNTELINEINKKINFRHITSQELGWCKGLAGDLIAYGEVNDKRVIKNLYNKWSSIRKLGYGSPTFDDTLCHGMCSILEAELTLKKYGYCEDEKIINNISALLMNKIDDSNILVKTVDNIFSVDLFTGVTGIGYSLLRKLYPDIVTNVLTLK